MSPSATWEIAEGIVGANGAYERTLSAGRTAVAIIRRAVGENRLRLSTRELQWLNRIDAGLSEMPPHEAELWEEMLQQHEGSFDPSSYGWVQ